jgi:esterase/lipase superfamily enzyme
MCFAFHRPYKINFHTRHIVRSFLGVSTTRYLGSSSVPLFNGAHMTVKKKWWFPMTVVSNLNSGYRRTCALLLCLLGATLQIGCATKVRELMPTPTVFHLPTAQAIFDDVPVERRTDYIDLLYITDRAPDARPDAELPYGQERARSVGFGSAQVALRPPMTWDELRRHSLSDPRSTEIAMKLGAVKELGRYPAGPYPVEATKKGFRRGARVMEAHRRANTALKSEVQRRLKAAPSGEVVLYVHGFNETFATAAYTAAELCHFFGRAHVCGLFTWPASSTGNPLISFTSTTESATYSVGHLKKTIRTLAQTPGVEGLHLLAHSRGSALLLNAIRELCIEAIASGESPSEALKFENWVLMSPDIDAAVARAQLEIFASDPDLMTRWRSPELPKFLRGRFTIYASPEDRALLLSKFLFRSKDRVGELTAEDISDATSNYFAKFGNVDIIVFEGRRTDFFGHSYFASNPLVSADLVELIRKGTRPGDPGRPMMRSGKITWVFPDQ